MKVKKIHFGIGTIMLFIVILTLGGSYLFWGTRISLYYDLYNTNDIIKGGKAYTSMQNTRIDDYTLPAQYNINILKYDISIELIPEEKRIKSTVLLTGMLKEEQNSNIVLNFHDGFEISGFTVNGSEESYIYKNNFIRFDNYQGADTFLVEIKYSGTPENNGFGSFEFKTFEDMPMIYSMNEPIYASTWFPCNDITNDKALLTIAVTADSNLVTASNGVLTDIILNGSKKTYTWETNYPISTYLISIATADYTNFKDYYAGIDTLQLDYYVLPGKLEKAKRDFEVNKKALKCFEELFGPYPFYGEKYGIAEFLWNDGAMEHQTITGVSSLLITGNGFFDDFYIHELAHHWWGNAVGPDSWKDIWLNEGFATYSEALYYEYYNGEAALISTMESSAGSFEDTRLYAPEGFLFSETIYDKGAWVLHMLRGEVGDSTFFMILKEYYRTFKYGNASTSDFIKLSESVSGKSLNKFFKDWVYEGKGIINVDYIVNDYQQGDDYITDIEMLQANNSEIIYNFPLEVRFVYYDGHFEDYSYRINSPVQKISFRSKNIVKEVMLDPRARLLAQFRDVSREE